MRKLLVLGTVLLASCLDRHDGDPPADSGPDRPRDAPVGYVCDAFGEACKSEPYPANTVCHGDDGWCIDNVCRPMCASDTRVCDSLVRRVAPAGAGYCEPR